ncbi:hypothetical protein LJB96_05095, partial [Methanobrevibacter sp. OttesenSCG-928-K11]|nr:hypothetical protein [Methanobrevibacter sp. OttesenSCG-928-K11]
MPLIFLSIGASFAADLNQENEFLSSENNYNDSIESSSISLNNTESFQTNILEDSSKINTVINSNNLIKHYKNNSQFQIELKDTNGLPLANMTIFFTIQGTTYSKNTTENGIAILNINLGPGNYNIISSFRGNDNYNSYSVNNTISVLSLIEGNDLFKYYKNGSQYYARILDDKGNFLVNKDVSMNINGVFYTKSTDSNGIVKLSINLFPGEYTLTVINPHDNLRESNKITVFMMETKIVADDFIRVDKAIQNFSIKYIDIHGNPLFNLPVYFNFNNNIYNTITDNNGMAFIVLNLNIGKYDISYGYNGDRGYKSTQDNNIINIIPTNNIFIGKDISLTFPDEVNFNINFTDLNGNPLTNKTITFEINNIKYTKNTNNLGTASINLKINPGVYEITYYHGSEDSKDYNIGKNTITIYKILSNLTGNNLIMLPDDGSSFKVLLTDAQGNPLPNKNIIFTINGINYTKNTNYSGIASIKINLKVGYYTVVSTVNDEIYTSKELKNTILVNGTILTPLTDSIIQGESYKVLLTDAYGNCLSNEKITFTINNRLYDRITDNNGIASIKINLNRGNYQIYYKLIDSLIYKDNNGESSIKISTLVNIQEIISISTSLEHYIANYFSIPTLFNIGGEDYTMAESLYLFTVACKNIKENNFNQITLPPVDYPSNNLKTPYLWSIYMDEYLNTASFISEYIKLNGISPNTIETSRGTVAFDGMVYTYVRIISYYAKHGVLPEYIHIRPGNVNLEGSVLNNQNTISNLGIYLSSSANCQVYNSLIQAKALEITEGLNNNLAKAFAIFNYVKEEIDYEEYYNTRYGAVGTLNSKVGNCVDGTHLLVALSRAAGLPARYVHGTCSFSGSTTGHVWAQILIDGTWIVGDTSSSKNSFGVINNWNNYNPVLHGIYASCP